MRDIADQIDRRQQFAPDRVGIRQRRLLIEGGSRHIRMMLRCSLDGFFLRPGQAGKRRRRLQPAGKLADHALIAGPGRFQLALGGGPLCDGACQPRFRLRDIGARHLADLELVARRLKAPAQHIDIVDRQLDHGLVADHVHERHAGAEENSLLDRDEPGALRGDAMFRAPQPRGGLLPFVKRLPRLEFQGCGTAFL